MSSLLPRTFLTQLTPARVAEAMRRVQARIWHPIEEAGARIAVAQTEPSKVFHTAKELRPEQFSPVPDEPFHWGPKYAQSWFRVSLPEKKGAGTRYLSWRDQGEATIYLEGVPYSGLDVAHPYCPLPDATRELLIESVCIRSGVWLAGEAAKLDEEGSAYLPPKLFSRDDLAWSVYHDLKLFLELIAAEYREYQAQERGLPKDLTSPVRYSPPAFRASPLYRRLSARLEQAIDALDRDGLTAADAELKKIYREFKAAPDAPRVVLTGHAHIDLVWLWPERVGEFKAVHSWSTQVRLLKEYPEFRFGYSQPASYEAVGRHAPELLDKVKNLIAGKRWDAIGASYVEGDTQMPCGEAILRCLRIGQDEFVKLRGSRSEVFWLPDVFGYSGAMPQLLNAVGVKSFFTTKLSWSTVNRFPHTSFLWEGPDGAAIKAHVVLIHDYNEWVDVKRLRESVLHHQQSGIHPEQLIPTGYGDGGGGPTEEMIERARRLSDLAGVPKVEWGNVEPFFERLDTIKDELPVVTGELMLELHRGVFTTHGSLKAAFRGLERALQILEAAHVVRKKGPVDLHYWKRATFSHFHDYIPGSSIWEVYAEAIPELEQLAAKALSEARAVLDEGSGEKASAADGWFNPLPLARTWVDGADCYELPPLSGAPRGELKKRAVSAPAATPNSLRSERVQAGFDENGSLVSLEVDGESLAVLGHQLMVFPDHPAAFEAWDVDRAHLSNGQTARLVEGGKSTVEGLVASVSFEYALADHSRVRVTWSVRAGEPVLRVRYDVDWQDPLHWLKAVWTTDYRGREARFGAPVGSVLRGQWPGHPREEAQWEVPGSRWAVLMDDAQSEGLALITEAKYGFTVREGRVGVSLLRSALVTEADHHPRIRDTPDRPHHSDLGRHRIELALGRYAPNLPVAEQAAALADVLYTPCVPYAGGAVSAGLAGLDGLRSCVPSWAEPLADGTWALRLHETLGRRGKLTPSLDDGWRARESDVYGVASEKSGDSPTVAIRPYGLTTLRMAHS